MLVKIKYIVQSYGCHLIIDTSILSDPNYIKTQNTPLLYTYLLEDVAKTVTVNGNNYCLTGIIFYINYGSLNNGHYIAFTHTGLNWYKYDDLMTKRSTAYSTEEICPHVIFYIKHNT